MTCELCTKEYTWKTSNGSSKRFCASCHVGLKRLRLKYRAVAYLGGRCKHCEIEGPLAVLDFHHRDPTTKEASLAALFSSAGWGRIQRELDKCDLLCANCHRIVEASFEARAQEILGVELLTFGRSELETRPCDFCEIAVTRQPSEFGDRTFCSHACSNKYRART